MKRIACLTVLLAGLAVIPAWAESRPAAPAGVPGQPVLQRTVAAALSFLEPRILDPVPIRQLTLWGLRGLTAIDPDLGVEADEENVVLLQFGRVAHAEPLPRTSEPGAWASLVEALSAAASRVSDPVRAGGVPGITQAFFDELFNHLDPYSRYVAPSPAGADRARRDGTASPGMTLARRGGDWVVATVDPRGPAAEAGLRPGDRVLDLDGQTLRGMTDGAVQDLLDGPEGSVLAVTARRRDDPRAAAAEFEIERASVPPETVFASRDGQALVIRVTGFNRATESGLTRELQRFVRDASPSRPRSLILDLRGNRGGLLRQAANAAALLVRQGIVAVTSGRNPAARHLFRAEDGDLLDGKPVVVLVDGRTASSAEILAAALADLRRAVVVGSSTLGKGLVQTVTTLPDGGELFVTWSRVLAPGDWPIQGLGVLPQVCTSRGAQALDAQLRALRAGRLEAAQAIAAHHAARAPLSSAMQMELRSACRAAEGSELDMRAARALLADPQAYQAALIGPFSAATP